jgi:hypothetical protein
MASCAMRLAAGRAAACVSEFPLHALVTRAGKGVGEGRKYKECQSGRGRRREMLGVARETIRQLTVFMLTRRAAALAAMRPTLLYKLE